MAIDVNAVVTAGKSYGGLSPLARRKVYAAILCDIVKVYSPSFNCNTQSNGCVSCLSPEKLSFLQVQLLCLINKVSTPSFDCSASALVTSQSCLLCAEPSVQLTVLVTLASESLLVLNGSANVDPSALLTANNCIACLDSQALEVEIALLLIGWLSVFQTVDVPGLVDDCDCNAFAVPGSVSGPFGFLPLQAIQFAPLATSPPSAGPDTPVATAATNVTDTSFSANWNAASGATSYRLDVSTSAGFGSFVGIYNNLNVGNVTTFSVTGLSAFTQYFYRLRAVNGGGTSANSNTITVTTTIPLTNLLAQWESDTLVLNDGDPVATWNDSSVNARNATQAVAGQRPLYKVNIFGTKPAILFDGSNDQLGFTSTVIGAFTAFSVIMPLASGSPYSVGHLTWGEVANLKGFMLDGDGSGSFFAHCTIRSGGAEILNKKGSSTNASTKHLLTWTFDGAATVAARNNGAPSVLTNNDGGFGPMTNGQIGMAFVNYNGYIAAIMVYNAVLSAGDITAVETYLNGKYPCF
jgi:hypothetical protein